LHSKAKAGAMRVQNAKKIAFTKLPPLVIYAIGIVIFISFSFNLFLRSFFKESSSKLPSKTLEARFLENLMIREGGLYTLLGSKPITIFDIESKGVETEEDLLIQYKEFEQFLKRAEEEKNLPEEERTAFNPQGIQLPSYEDYKKGWEKSYKLSAKKLWSSWEKNHKIIDPKFRLFSRKPDDSSIKMGIFVNVPNLVYTLYQYQSVFSHRTGITFDIQKVVDEIEDKDSAFWNAVFGDHYLLGIICGYGEKNAFLYDWGEKHFPRISKEKSLFFSRDKSSNHKSKEDVYPKDLSTPVFFHFGLADQTKINYELEKQKIVQFFDDKDFVQETLNILLKEE
jgi:hypothetical protein